MIHNVYSLRDRKAELFLMPFCAVSLGLVVRQLSDAVNSGSQDSVAMHPEDFVLCKLGTFDDVQGRYELFPLPDMVLECSTLVRAPRGVAVPAVGGEGA